MKHPSAVIKTSSSIRIPIASAIVIPNITGTESNLLTAQVRQTASAFNFARRIAIVKGAPQVATLFQMDIDEQSLKDGEKFLQSFLPVVDTQLGRHKYLAGAELTLADFNLLAVLDCIEYPSQSFRSISFCVSISFRFT